MVRYITVDAAPPPPRTARYSHAVEAGGVVIPDLGEQLVAREDPAGFLHQQAQDAVFIT